MAKKKETLTVEELVKQAIVPKEEEPYRIPDNWVWTRFDNIFSEISKNIPSVKQKEYLLQGCIPIIDQGKKLIGGYCDKNYDFNFLPIPVIIFGDHTRTIKYVDFNFIVGAEGVKVLKTFNGGISKFYFYYLKSLNISNLGYRRHFSILKEYKFPLPPLEEQKRIVKKVESLLDKISQVREIIKETREKAVLRKESLLNKAFTGELTAKWRESNLVESAQNLLVKINEEKMKKWEDECKKAEKKGIKKPNCKTVAEMIIPKEEEPYKIPDNWVWTRLGEVSEVNMGQSPAGNTVTEDDSGIGLIGGPVDMGENYPKITRYTTTGNKLSEKGDLIISVRATLGKTILSDGVYCLGRGVAGIRSVLSILFFRYYFKNMKEYLYKLGTGTTFLQISKNDILNLEFPLPPLEEQIEIVKILDRVMEQEKEVDRLCDMENTLELLEKSILDRAFRGELGTNIPEEESALEILRKIKER